MRVGIALPQYGVDVEPGRDVLAEALRAVTHAETSRLDDVWVSDHPFAVAPDGTMSGALEPLVLLGAAARGTSRVRLGTLVLSATMRAGALVAHAFDTLGRAAPGRVVAGVGTGWYAPEHRAFGVDLAGYDARLAMLEVTLDALGALGHRRPPILVGGSGDGLLELAARRADAWNVAWDVPPERFRALSRRLDEHCHRAGRDPAIVKRSVGVTMLVAEDERGLGRAVERLRGRAAFLAGVEREVLDQRIVCGTPERCAERLAAYGADEIVAALLLRDDPEMLELFAAEVASRLR